MDLTQLAATIEDVPTEIMIMILEAVDLQDEPATSNLDPTKLMDNFIHDGSDILALRIASLTLEYTTRDVFGK
jgi:hypothetical protein